MFYSLLYFKSRRAYLNFTQLYILQNFHHLTWIEDDSSRTYQLFSFNETLLKALTFIYRLFSFARGIKKSQAQDPSQIWPKNPKNAKVNPNCETNLLATGQRGSRFGPPETMERSVLHSGYQHHCHSTMMFFFYSRITPVFFYFPVYPLCTTAETNPFEDLECT